ncbi:MAG: hypothetical protein JO345_27135 [Streptosporangiaceae bacterium]|nr:hypothetical protein [Streptosporangiaceae bacterium]
MNLSRHRRKAICACVAGTLAGILAAVTAPGASAAGPTVGAGTVPAIASLNGSLEDCFVDNNGTLDTSAGGPSGFGALGGCSVAGFNGNMYVAWTDPSTRQVAYATMDFSTGVLNGIIRPENVFSPFAPSLAAWNNNLYIAWTGTDGRLNVRDLTTVQQATFEASSHAPALTGGPGYLEIAWVGSTNIHLNVAALSAALSETCKETFAQSSVMTPGLTTLNGRPYLSWIGEDVFSHINLIADTTATNGCAFPDTEGKLGDAYESQTTAGLSPSNGAVWMIWGGETDGALNIAQS